MIVSPEDRARLAAILGDRSRPLKHIQRAQVSSTALTDCPCSKSRAWPNPPYESAHYYHQARPASRYLYGRATKYVEGSGFGKADFALALLARDPAAWPPPHDIVDGLHRLENEAFPQSSRQK